MSETIADSRTMPVEVDVDLVGNYALNLFWTDGHDTGIYSFRKLRELCPCKGCRPQGVENLGVPQE